MSFYPVDDVGTTALVLLAIVFLFGQQFTGIVARRVRRQFGQQTLLSDPATAAAIAAARATSVRPPAAGVRRVVPDMVWLDVDGAGNVVAPGLTCGADVPTVVAVTTTNPAPAVTHHCAYCDTPIAGEPGRDRDQVVWLGKTNADTWCNIDCRENDAEQRWNRAHR